MDVMDARRRLLAAIKKKSKNLYNSATDTLDAFWRANSPLGELVTQRTGYTASAFIKVSPNTTYTVNYNGKSVASAAGMVFWQDNSTDYPIDGVNLYAQTRSLDKTFYTFTTPANCQYLTLSTFSGGENVQLELGDTATSYEPYY